MPEPHRAAVYYVPEPDDPLWSRGCAWLGRDPLSGERLPQPPVAGLEGMTESPRRYGFHATLKPPMALRHGLDAFIADAAALAARMRPFDLPPLDIANLHGFLALCLAGACPPMRDLADACVVELDHHRVPEDAAARARRAEGRPAAERAYIERWGYPLVFDAFRFHMTLTDRIADNPLVPAAAAHFGETLAASRRVTGIAVFVEEGAGAPFRLARRLRFGA